MRSVGPFHTIAFGMNEAVLVGPDSLLERELEVERVRGILRAVGRREGHVVEGPAGIGKSRLLEIARTRASDLGFRVLSARATELEQGFPLGVVRQLFERVITEAESENREEIRDGLGDGPKLLHVAISLLELSGRGGDQRRDLAPVPGLRDHRERWCGGQVGQRGDVLGCAGRPGAERLQQVRVGVGRVEDRPRVHHRPQGMQGKLELRDDAEAPAPPRSPQSRSAFSVSLACTRRPSAVTTSAATRLSQASPCLRISQPMPRPRVNPATPAEEIRPPVVASPCAWVSWSPSAHTAPPPTLARRAAGST